jgi:hypothetical protein
LRDGDAEVIAAVESGALAVTRAAGQKAVRKFEVVRAMGKVVMICIAPARETEVIELLESAGFAHARGSTGRQPREAQNE